MMRERMRTTFLVGRLTPGSTEMVVAGSLRTPAPIPGPWTLRALVRVPGPRIEIRPAGVTVH
jgi:hypothetical protein